MNSTRVGNFRLEAALKLAGRGWSVFPLHWPKIGASNSTCSCGDRECASPGKHPLTANGFKDGSTDPNVLRGWWERWPQGNIGIATGEGSGIVVLDVDTDRGGEAAFVKLVENRERFVTLESRTGGGGRHLIFAHPGVKIPNSSDKIDRGLDVRGDGGYIVAAPSLHESASRYEWLNDNPVAPLPAWLRAKMIGERPAPATSSPTQRSTGERALFWLGKALAKSAEGNRNDTGLWLATQLRDDGIGLNEAEGTMCQYAARVPQGGKRYTDAEALATVRGVYRTPPREPARNPTRVQPSASKAPATAPVTAPPRGAASGELWDRLEGVIDGRIYNVPMPHDQLTRLTQCLLPGTVTVVCGEPGVGKTFWVLQCVRFWHDNGHEAAAFFVEKDRVFHTMRLLAQLEGRGCFVDYEWIKNHPKEVTDALARHAQYIDSLGDCLTGEAVSKLTLENMGAWVSEQCQKGKRVLVIDPITAIDAGQNRWQSDQDFMIASQSTLTKYGASLVLVTHPVKGFHGKSSGHSQAGGTAYHRFSDTNLWIRRTEEPTDVVVQRMGVRNCMKLDYFTQIHKARHGKGGGCEIGYTFGDGLVYAEQGVVIGDEQ